MTRTWVAILAVSLVILASCSAEEEEQEGAVKAVEESDSDVLDRETRAAGRKPLKGRRKRKNGTLGRRKAGKAGRKEGKVGRKAGKTGRKTGKAGRKAGKKGSKTKKNLKRRQNKKGKGNRKFIKKGGKRRLKKKPKQKKNAEGVRKAEKAGGTGTKRILLKSPRKEMKFSHCQYLDLTEIGLRNDSICEAGGKFLFKAEKGHRRQFLMTNTSNIAVFLKHRHKITNCTNLTDITMNVKCKAVPGTEKLFIKSDMGGCLRSCSKEAVSPDLIINKPATAPTSAIELGSATTVFCPCPESRTFICSTKVVSTGNQHTITCNNMASVSVSCGSDLVGAKNVLGLKVDWYKHKLCSKNEYKSILKDFTWRCKDRNVAVPASPWCKGDPATTMPTMTTGITTGAPTERRRMRPVDMRVTRRYVL